MPDNNQRPTTSTQIRNFYSEGISYMNMSFFNTNLSFKFYPFIPNNNGGTSKYDMKNGQCTTVDFEGASALQKIAEDIINGITTECNLPIPCAAGASLNLERKIGQNGQMETIFSITKNGVTIPYKFSTISCKVKENGQVIDKTIEVGLIAFSKTIDGYLTGINADRHLDKLTEDFIKSQQSGNNQQGGNNTQQNGFNNYNKNNSGYRKPYNGYNNNNGYRKGFQGNNNNFNNNNQQNNWQPKQQNMSSYNIPN